MTLVPAFFPGVVAAFNPANPTAPALTTAYKMQGLGSIFVPCKSGNVLYIVTATVNATATTVGNGINLQPYCGLLIGSASAPANAGAIPANAIAIGGVQSWATGVTLTTDTDSFIPMTVVGLAQNLNINQQYWFDLAAESVTTISDNALVQLSAFIVEV